ncbi:MAG: alginate export family protein [Nitrospirae bacterium]|nr:alginate export family protein [Nitrospirota bacterium]
MKKLAVVVMVMVFALGFALAAYADDTAPSDTAVVAKGDTKITLGGEIRFRGEYTDDRYNQINSGTRYSTTTVATSAANTVTVTSTDRGPISPNNDHQAYYDGRVRINMDAKVADNVHGYIELESGNGTNSDTWNWGNAGAATYPTATSGSGSTGVFPSGNSEVGGGMFIRQAWIAYEMPMWGVKTGHQLLILGNGLFFDHTRYGDDAIVVYVNPVKNLTIAGLTAKFQSGPAATSVFVGQTTASSPNGTGKADNADGYVLLAAYKGNNFNISGDITAVNDQAFAAVTIPVHAWNFGLRADGTISAFTLRGDLELQTGELIMNTPGVSDGRLKGWAGLAGIDYKVGPWKLTGEFAYGSGKAGSDGSANQPEFITSLGNDQHYTYVYEYRTKAGSGIVSSGLTNTMYVKGGASVDITEQLKAETYLYWLQAPQAVALNDASGPAAFTGASTNLSALTYTPNYSRNLGWELDGKVTYAFAKNLQWWIEGGYFWTGTAYNYRVNETTYVNTVNPGPPVTYTAYTYGRDNAYAIRNGIELKF